MTTFHYPIDGPVLACFGLSGTPKLRSAIKAVVKKYPNITLACFDEVTYNILYDFIEVEVLSYPFGQAYVMEEYNVIGALVGVDYQGDTFGLKEMRV